MKLKGSTFFYLFVVIFVGSVYYFDYYRGEQEQVKKDQEAVLLPISKDLITRIVLKNASGEFELQQSDKGWTMVRPFTDQVSIEDLNSWVQSLTSEKSMDQLGAGESFQWGTYGLAQPTATLEVQTKSGENFKLELASRKSFEGNPFIRKNDEKLVYVGSSTWTSLFDKSAKDLRERKILRKSLGGLESLKISQGRQNITLKMQDGRWSSGEQPTWLLDQNKVREFINIIPEMKAQEFVLETLPDSKTAASYGLAKPAITVTYQMKEGAPFVAQFGQDKSKNWYFQSEILKRVAKLETALVEKLLHAKVLDWRDREQPFLFKKETIQKLNLQSEKKVELTKESGSWKGSTPDPVDEVAVEQWLQKLRDLRVAEFLDGKSSAPGLDKAQQQFILQDDTGKNVFELKVGAPFKKKEDKVEKSYVYVKTSLYPDVVAIKEEDVKQLSFQNIFKTPATEEKKQ